MSRLIDELRKVANSVETIPARHISHLAADRIEELEAERETWDGYQVCKLLRKDVAELESQLAEHECVWTKSIMGIYGEYDNWATSCGEDFAITEEWHEMPTPYCSNCGGKTREAIINKEEANG